MNQGRRDVFQAIADPVRRDILSLLAQQELQVSSIADQFEISRPAISKHLKILNECGLLSYQKRGRERYCRIQPESLKEVSDWINTYQSLLEDKLDQFESYLHQFKANQQPNE